MERSATVIADSLQFPFGEPLHLSPELPETLITQALGKAAL